MSASKQTTLVSSSDKSFVPHLLHYHDLSAHQSKRRLCLTVTKVVPSHPLALSRLVYHNSRPDLHRVKMRPDGGHELKPLLVVSHGQRPLHDVVGVLIKDQFSDSPLLSQLFNKLGLGGQNIQNKNK